MQKIGFQPNTISQSIKTSPIELPVDYKHALCLGATGSGKTASFIFPILVNRIKKKHAIIFFDHKGHEHLKIKALAKKENRLQDIIEIGKPHGTYINIMDNMDSNRLKEAIKGTNVKKNIDDYWGDSSASLAVGVVDFLRQAYSISQTLKVEFDCKINIFEVIGKNGKPEIVHPNKHPSFETLSYIISTPKSMINFQKNIVKMIDKIERTIKILLKDTEGNFKYLISQKYILIDYQKQIEKFLVNASSDAGTGNNAVLQYLTNSIMSISKKPYVNIGESDIINLISKNSIIIIDTQSIDISIYKVLFESILIKLSSRIRNGHTLPVSIFIDEANRVLSPNIDIHNDVLREAQVELILAAQNEEQMIEKFGINKWNSINQMHISLYSSTRFTPSLPLF